MRLLKIISVLFYDVTTLYFEAEKEDELRKTGFSKDGKHQHPQIVLGLSVSYSEKRGLKDKYNRQRGLQKLEKQIQSGKLTKSNINNKGYNKYLKLEGSLKISLDLSKPEEHSK